MKGRALHDDDSSGPMVIVRAILAATATLILAGATVELPAVDPVAVVTGIVRILLG